MGIFLNWAANKGMDYTKGSFTEMIGFPSFEAVISEKLDIINQKLDVLIQAPFRQAKMHLLEGNLDKCKDKLIEAISVNEFDLPAIALYSLLLFKSGNIPLALEYFEQIIKKFGPHKNLLSDKIVDIYSDYLNNEKPLRKIKPFIIKLDSYRWYPVEINCSLSSIVIHWKPKDRHSWEDIGGSRGYHRHPRYTIHDWKGNVLFDNESYDWINSQIAIVTEEYLVIEIEKGLFFKTKQKKIFRVKDGYEVFCPYAISSEQFFKLFLVDKRFVSKIKSVSETAPADLSFGGAHISLKMYKDYTEREIHIYPI